MSAGGADPAGSSRISRLDPLSLPVRFRTADPGADGLVRLVEIHHHGVVMYRSVRGMRMVVKLPVTAFQGVAMRMVRSPQANAGAVMIMLEHCDPALSVPLFAAPEAGNVLAEWRLWGRVLAAPLLVTGDDGGLRAAFPHLGAVRTAESCERRRRWLRTRRPRILMRRKQGRPGTGVVYREREITARN
jgi:hypothetical protein